MTFFEVAKEVIKYLGYFYNKLCHLDIPKIPQSGHTGCPVSLTMLATPFRIWNTSSCRIQKDKLCLKAQLLKHSFPSNSGFKSSAFVEEEEATTTTTTTLNHGRLILLYENVDFGSGAITRVTSTLTSTMTIISICSPPISLKFKSLWMLTKGPIHCTCHLHKDRSICTHREIVLSGASR